MSTTLNTISNETIFKALEASMVSVSELLKVVYFSADNRVCFLGRDGSGTWTRFDDETPRSVEELEDLMYNLMNDSYRTVITGDTMALVLDREDI